MLPIFAPLKMLPMILFSLKFMKLDQFENVEFMVKCPLFEHNTIDNECIENISGHHCHYRHYSRAEKQFIKRVKILLVSYSRKNSA